MYFTYAQRFKSFEWSLKGYFLRKVEFCTQILPKSAIFAPKSAILNFQISKTLLYNPLLHKYATFDTNFINFNRIELKKCSKKCKNCNFGRKRTVCHNFWIRAPSTLCHSPLKMFWLLSKVSLGCLEHVCLVSSQNHFSFDF